MKLKFFNILYLLIILCFAGCAQQAALVGPTVTVATSGNLAKGAISYGSDKIIKGVTGKNGSEIFDEALKKVKKDKN